MLTDGLNELVATHQAYAVLEQKFQAMTMEPSNEGGPTFIVKPFKGDKKERIEEAILTTTFTNRTSATTNQLLEQIICLP